MQTLECVLWHSDGGLGSLKWGTTVMFNSGLICQSQQGPLGGKQ